MILSFLSICLVEEQYTAITSKNKLRKRGFPPKLSDAEVITIEICGEYLGLNEDKAIFGYFRKHYSDWFPALKDRTAFVRQAANLWQVKAQIQQRLVQLSGQMNETYQIIDTAPLPVCEYVRSRRDRCFKPDADYGYCAAKDMHYYGFKLGLRTSRIGMITHFDLLPARPHDIQLLDDLLDGFQQGTILADKGFIDAYRQALLAQRGVYLVAQTRKNMATLDLPQAVRKQFRRWRKKIETVIAQLAGRFQIERIRARDLWHFQSRLVRKILAHTVCVFINLQLGRSPLDFSGLVTS
jgi:hypothetical protein